VGAHGLLSGFLIFKAVSHILLPELRILSFTVRQLSTELYSARARFDSVWSSNLNSGSCDHLASFVCISPTSIGIHRWVISAMLLMKEIVLLPVFIKVQRLTGADYYRGSALPPGSVVDLGTYHSGSSRI
jgi:hypothetical protein